MIGWSTVPVSGTPRDRGESLSLLPDMRACAKAEQGVAGRHRCHCWQIACTESRVSAKRFAMSGSGSGLHADPKNRERITPGLGRSENLL